MKEEEEEEEEDIDEGNLNEKWTLKANRPGRISKEGKINLKKIK